ncbi:MAG: 2-oxo acid dehydrogenase subunit E2, partial [Pseudolabrys sp.]
LKAIACGVQVAIMAPTEIQAEHHWRNFSDWFRPLGIEPAWLSGSQRAVARREALEAIADGSAELVVGTHALFQEGVEFHRLALVVIDEQHRFGVHQRMALRDKGAGKDGGDDIVYRNYYDIGMAIGSGRGLVVPVVRNAERLSFAEIEAAIADFAARAKGNKLKLEELQGGTFTITNGGVYGSLLSTPLLNPPQSGILGLHAIQERPVAIDGAVVIRPMMYVALSYDHRLVDGREAVTFLKRVKETIETPARMLLEV